MDLDVYVAAHRPQWDRLAELVARRRRLDGAEADELVELYRRTATHASVLRSAAPDSALVIRVTTLVARARAAVTESPEPGWRAVTAFLLAGFPAAVYRARHWWVATGVAVCLTSAAVAGWVAANPRVQAAIGTPQDLRRLATEDFVDYYSENPATSFALRVWTNNAWIAAACLVLGVFLGLPVLYLLWQNAASLGIAAGIMASADRLGLFFGLITPHGLLELTAVFIAAGTGLRLGWTVVDPGPRRRLDALAEEGRVAVGMAMGLALVLLVSGVVEAFVTPSGLPTWARIAVGAAVWVAFLAYVWVLGARAVRAGETGDVLPADRAARAPVAAGAD